MLKLIISFSLLYRISFLFNNNSRKSAENLIIRNQNNEIIKINNWTRLLILDEKINFYFLNTFLHMTSVIYCRTFYIFSVQIQDPDPKHCVVWIIIYLLQISSVSSTIYCSDTTVITESYFLILPSFLNYLESKINMTKLQFIVVTPQ